MKTVLIGSLEAQLAKLSFSGIDMLIQHTVDFKYEFSCFDDLQRMYRDVYHPESGHLLKKERIDNRFFLIFPIKMELNIRHLIMLLNCYNKMAEEKNGSFVSWKVRLKAI
ncbi:hypothetical protein [Thalassotalea sp. SU-HH00458]|uniref:hypothetical protein n=1 Tax=Thalassotalea sp. SU-HH00458 TaxID=3127657 RepID=UPI003365A3AA